jgi:hypothetical protein
MTSGSNQWELEIEKDGVKVYSIKSSGSSMKIFKCIARGQYTLSQFVAALLLDDDGLESCRDWIPTCFGYEPVEPWSSQTLSNTNLWRIGLFFPFSPREIVNKSLLSQDKQSKALSIDVIAAPNKIPPNDGYVRVTELHNTWRLNPLENGEIEIEFVQDVDLGGLFPDFLTNLAGPSSLYTLLHTQLPGLLDKEKYRNAKFDFIEELNVKKE